MIADGPPHWLQRTLLLFLTARDREAICGDLIEEYREGQLPQIGSRRANYWYLRQVASLASAQAMRGPLLKRALELSSIFIIIAGTWLAVMENVLKHSGFGGRSVIAAAIALQGLATLICVLLNGRGALRKLVTLGAAAILLLGCSAILNDLRASHFEGFVLVVGLALILDAVLTFATVPRMRGLLLTVLLFGSVFPLLAQPHGPANEKDVESAVEPLFNSQLKAGRYKAAAIVLVKNNEVLFAKGF